MSITSLRAEAHPFQNQSRAGLKEDRGVSNQGSSSKNTTRRPLALSRRTVYEERSALRRAKASNQSEGMLRSRAPYSMRLRLNDLSCALMFWLAIPVA